MRPGATLHAPGREGSAKKKTTVVFRTVRLLSCVSCCAVRSVPFDSLYWAHVPYDKRSSDVVTIIELLKR